MKESEEIPTRRFELATDSVARTRLENFRNGVKSFQAKHPEVLGATVFGSMVKGEKANAESDIDGFLYIDGETLPQEEKSKSNDQISAEYKAALLEELQVPKEEEKEYYGDLRCKVLTEEFLDEEIKMYLEYKKKVEDYDKIIDDSYEKDMSEEERNLLREQRPEYEDISSEIGGMFHGRVGSGIEKYRHMFLEKLMMLPKKENAEEIWKLDVYAVLTQMEGRWSEGKAVKFPPTFEDALRIYHPELYRQMLKAKDEEKIAELRQKIEQRNI